MQLRALHLGPRAIVLAALLSSIPACGGTTKAPSTPESSLDDDSSDAEVDEGPPPPSESIVPDSARPFTGYRAADGKTFTEESLITHLASADAVCIGERHDQPLDHYAQLRVLEGMAERRDFRGYQLGLAMEMVPGDEQGTMTAYQDGRIDGAEFETRSQWKQNWGFPIQYYRPQMELAVSERLEMLGLGVERSLTKEIAKVGFAGLHEEKQGWLPEVDPSSPEHRALFDTLMADHPMDPAKANNYYQAQLVWDEQMAETSAAWMGTHAPGRKLVILAGAAHCHHSAIPSRIERRGDFTVVSLLPVDSGAPRTVAAPPQSAEDQLTSGYDYQMVFSQ